MKGLGTAFLGLEAYLGYQEGGVWGATKQVGAALAFQYGLGAMLGGAAVPVTLGLMAGAAVAGGIYAYNKYGSQVGRETMFEHSRIEMGGGPINDQFGTISTMRRRSMAALQSTRLNGTTALGNEAALSHVPYFR
jgi:hypothetical protein